MQFTIVFRRFFNSILSAGAISDKEVTDIHLSEFSNNIFVTYPFIAVQKEFGYSDVTPRNNQTGYITKLFKGTEERLRKLDKVKTFFRRSLL